MSAVTIRRATAADAGALGRLIATSFNHLAIGAWLVDDPTERRVAMAGQFEILIAHAIEHGDVEMVDGPDGPVAVAAWFRPGPVPDIDDYDERLAVACGVHTVRFAALDALMHERHPESPDHAYLAFLAVDGAEQGRGLGSALLESYHARLGGSPAYLEASSPRSRALYVRHGYTDYGPPYGPEGVDGFWPMWRDA